MITDFQKFSIKFKMEKFGTIKIRVSIEIISNNKYLRRYYDISVYATQN